MLLLNYLKNTKMRIVTNITIDIYYNQGEIRKSKNKRKRYEKKGYDFQQTTDEPGEHAYCDQLIKTKIKVYKK